MRKFILLFIVAAFGFSFANSSCKNGNREKELGAINTSSQGIQKESSEVYFDSTLMAPFFVKYPHLKAFQPSVEALYKKHHYHYIWFDKEGINEMGDLIYSKITNIASEGVQTTIPYKALLDEIFQNENELQKPSIKTELLLSSLYFFYANKVYQGLDAKQTAELGWYLPRKKQSYVSYLDSLVANPSLMNKDEKEVIGQYYRLKEVLKHYRDMEKKGGWSAIELDTTFKTFTPGDSSKTIVQIRQHLFDVGDLAVNSKSALYDDTLKAGIIKFKKRNGSIPNAIITAKNIATMNVPISNRIKTIIVNMERCRWITSDITKAKEYIGINIPSFRFTYFKDNKPVLVSNVVVGKALNQTVVFSGMMQYVVFSPYWNVPKSIIKKEIAPAMAKNKNYLAEHNMEWNNGAIRQKPGPKNSLGLVKFLFPNNNNIYLHDTPSKSLFNEEKRAFSHGCIRIEKPKELANLLLKDDKDWSPEKIDAAMNKGKETWYTLKNKIPVYIGYFTAWVDSEGVIHFYDDIYHRDERLAELIFEK